MKGSFSRPYLLLGAQELNLKIWSWFFFLYINYWKHSVVFFNSELQNWKAVGEHWIMLHYLINFPTYPSRVYFAMINSVYFLFCVKVVWRSCCIFFYNCAYIGDCCSGFSKFDNWFLPSKNITADCKLFCQKLLKVLTKNLKDESSEFWRVLY